MFLTISVRIAEGEFRVTRSFNNKIFFPFVTFLYNLVVNQVAQLFFRKHETSFNIAGDSIDGSPQARPSF